MNFPFIVRSEDRLVVQYRQNVGRANGVANHNLFNDTLNVSASNS
jgi:hypothetical protein